MKKMNLEDIVNCHSGKTGFVCGMGPSLRPYLNIFKDMSLEKNKYVFVSCNDFDQMTEIDADFWVIASSVFTVDKSYNRFNNKPNTILLYADSVDMTDKKLVEDLLKIKYIPYDQRHFDNKDCPVKHCCKHRVEGRLTIQELLQKISKSKKKYGTGHTVALHSLATAVLLGCNPIYVSGVDLDYSKGYVDNKTSNNDSFDIHMSDMIEDFKIIKESAQNVGIEIINLSKESVLSSIFKTEKYNFKQ